MAIDEQNRDSQNAKPVRQIDAHFWVDDVDANTQYIGKRASLSTTGSDAGWALKKVVTSGTVTQTLYASGEPFDVYNKIWDNRAGYSYS